MGNKIFLLDNAGSNMATSQSGPSDNNFINSKVILGQIEAETRERAGCSSFMLALSLNGTFLATVMSTYLFTQAELVSLGETCL